MVYVLKRPSFLASQHFSRGLIFRSLTNLLLSSEHSHSSLSPSPKRMCINLASFSDAGQEPASHRSVFLGRCYHHGRKCGCCRVSESESSVCMGSSATLTYVEQAGTVFNTVSQPPFPIPVTLCLNIVLKIFYYKRFQAAIERLRNEQNPNVCTAQ